MASPWLRQTSRAIKRAIFPAGLFAGIAGTVAYYLPAGVRVGPAIRQSAAYAGGWIKYAMTAPAPDYTALSTVALVPFAGFVSAIFLGLPLVAFALYPLVDRSLYGSASWGDITDAKEQGLSAAVGAVVGAIGFLRTQILRPNAERNSIVIAPTRRGKTRGIVIPTILDYPGSIIAISTKAELSAHCADYRATLGPVHRICWADEHTPSGWSFTDVKTLPHNDLALERHAAQTAGLLFPDITGENSYFQESARRLCNCVFEYNFRRSIAEGKTITVSEMISEIVDMMAADAEAEQDSDGQEPGSLRQFLLKMAAEALTKKYPRRLYDNFRFFGALDYRSLSPIISTFVTGLDLLTYNTVQASTSRTSFSFADLRNEQRTVFIEFPLSDRTAYGKLTSLFFCALISYGLDNPPRRGQFPIKIVADEFKSLPKIPNLTDLFTSGAGNEITMDMVLQDFASVLAVYGKEALDEFMTNATYLIAFGQNNLATQKILSEKVGQETRKRFSTTSSFTSLFGGSRSQSLEGVPLVRPEDWGGIPFGRHVILTDGHMQRPLYVKTPFWDKYATYRNRVPSSCLK